MFLPVGGASSVGGQHVRLAQLLTSTATTAEDPLLG